MKLFFPISLSFLLVLWLLPSLDKNPFLARKNESATPITVRESTIDLQVRVGERLYVFGKASGNLEKVKVGMHVLDFAQSSQIEGMASYLKKVEWKKQKDGSILIRSSYDPWPNALSWIVTQQGLLKMEVSPASMEKSGVGFNFPESDLKEFSLDNEPKPTRELAKDFQKAEIKFSEVSLILHSASGKLGVETDFEDSKGERSDLVISFPPSLTLPETTIQQPRSASKSQHVGSNPAPIILWFDFH